MKSGCCYHDQLAVQHRHRRLDLAALHTRSQNNVRPFRPKYPTHDFTRSMVGSYSGPRLRVAGTRSVATTSS